MCNDSYCLYTCIMLTLFVTCFLKLINCNSISCVVIKDKISNQLLFFDGFIFMLIYSSSFTSMHCMHINALHVAACCSFLQFVVSVWAPVWAPVWGRRGDQAVGAGLVWVGGGTSCKTRDEAIFEELAQVYEQYSISAEVRRIIPF